MTATTREEREKKEKERAYEKISDTELENITRVAAAMIIRDMGITSPEKVVKDDDGIVRITLSVEGGFSAFGSATSRHAIKSVTGGPDNVHIQLVEKQY